MSASAAITVSPARPLQFLQTTAGKKTVMAVTGFILFGFLIGHMAGNLQFFAGKETINHYAAKLRELPLLLWGARAILLLSVTLHIWATVQLALLKKRARPVGYAKVKRTGSNYASRTMYWSGPIVAAFIVYHLLHLTWGVVNVPGYEHLNAYDNLVAGFSNPVVTLFYLFAVSLLMLHVYHGAWSMFQTLGVAHPRYTPILKLGAKSIAVILFAGFISVPVAVLAGVRP